MGTPILSPAFQDSEDYFPELCSTSIFPTNEALTFFLLPFSNLRAYLISMGQSSIIQLLPVLISPCVCPPLVFGVHTDGRRILATESLRIQTLLESLLSQLSLLSLLQLVEFVILCNAPLFVVIFVSLQSNDDVEEFCCLILELIRVHGVQVKGLDSDGEGELLLLLQLLLGLGHLPASISTSSTARLLVTSSTLFVSLLSFQHLLSLGFSFLKTLLFLLSFLGLFLILFLPQLLFLFFLLLVKLLFLLGSDLLPLSLLLLQLLQLLLLLLPGLPPLIDVFFECLVKSSLCGSIILCICGHG